MRDKDVFGHVRYLLPSEYSKLNGGTEKLVVPSAVPVSYAETRETFPINVRWETNSSALLFP